MKTTRLAWTTALAAGAMALAVAMPAVAQSPSAPSAAGKKITLMVGVKGDPFYVSMECGAREAATAAGVTLDVQGPDKFDATLQNPMLDAVGASAPGCAARGPERRGRLAPVRSRSIQDAGTKIVLVDTVVTDPTIGVSRIATDNKLGGSQGGRGPPGARRAERREGPRHLDRPGRLQRGRAHRGLQREGGRAGLRARLRHAVLAQRGRDRRPGRERGAGQGPRPRRRLRHQPVHGAGRRDRCQAGRQVGNVKVVGFDAGPDQIKQLEAGDVQALVAQKPYDIGVQGVQQAVAALTGQADHPGASRPSPSS